MTATPYTTDPMHLIKLINLMKDENDQMPEDYKTFTETYLDEKGIFTDEGAKEYLDNISPIIEKKIKRKVSFFVSNKPLKQNTLTIFEV